MVTKSYSEMIEEAVLSLGELRGSSRQAIWKTLSSQYDNADYKRFVVRLRKMRESNQISQTKGKFRLETNYKHKLLKALEKGKTGVVAVKGKKSAADKKKKGTSKGAMKKAKKQAMKERKTAAVAKRSSAKKGNKRGSSSAASSKAAKKATSGTGKKTTGSKKT